MGTSLARLRFWATVTFVVLVATGVGAAVLVPRGRLFFLGVSLVGVLAIPSYWALSLTLRLSNGKFYGAFVGGMFGRLLGMGAAVGMVWRFERAAVIPFVLAGVVGLVGFSFVEMFFIGRQNRLSI